MDMSEAAIVNDARVMAKGQVTIPKNIRNILGINTGDRVTFVVEDGTVRVVNSAIYALQRFQAQMKGEGKAAGLMNDDDVAAWITASRREEEAE
jgi:AbrB family looped-hinge helix DNA binding protein